MPKCIFNSLLIAVLFLSITSCKKNNVEAPSEGTTAVRPVGVAVSDGIAESIGPEGGIVKSEDGRVEIVIPASALTEDTDIGIQLLRNTALSGIGYSYRLSPHGKIFKRKVVVRFHYEKDESYLSNKEALEIAFQNENGLWTCVGGTVNDTVKKTVSVQTDHFSDWSLIASMELTPTVKTVGLNETVALKALHYLPQVDENDLLVPLTIPNAISGVPTKLDQKYIVKWTLNGPGKLESNGNEAVYTAPAIKPVRTNATVTAELNVHGKQVLLISTIHIIDEGISMSIDGGEWHTYPGTGVRMTSPNRFGIVSQQPAADLPHIVLSWPAVDGQNANGLYSWSMLGELENHVTFEDSDPVLKGVYTAVYEDNDDFQNSGGYTTAEEITEGGKKYVRGSFIISNSGVIDYATGKQKSISYIMGTYKVQRNW